MAAQQILVLFVQVRILVGQLWKPDVKSGFIFIRLPIISIFGYQSEILIGQVFSNNSKDKFSAICDLYSKKYKKEKNKRKITVRQSCCCVCTNKGCMSVWIISYCDAPCGF